MKFKNARELEKSIQNFIDECVNEIQEGGAQDSVQNLVDGVAKADEFTNRANQLFKDQDLKDENGNLIQVENPAQELDQIEPENGSQFEISEEGDRWLRSNKLYGRDILGKSGFKYNNR